MKTRLLSFLLLFLLVCSAQSQTYQPTEENLKSRQEFRDNRFGIFLHWGIYSMLATGEWTMTNKNLNYKEYAKLAGGFYPAKFDAARWVSAIKASGAKYICFTSRHHDGFSMFHTRFSDYNIVDATPFKRDILKEFGGRVPQARYSSASLLFAHRLVSRRCVLGDAPGRGTGETRIRRATWNSYYKFMNTS